MSWWQIVLMVIGALALIVSVIVVIVVRSLLRTVSELAIGLSDLKAQTLPLLADTRAALREASGVNRKADALLESAASLTGTADAASKLAYKAVTNPVVKVMAWATGSRRALARLAKSPEPKAPPTDPVHTPRTPDARKRWSTK